MLEVIYNIHYNIHCVDYFPCYLGCKYLFSIIYTAIVLGAENIIVCTWLAKASQCHAVMRAAVSRQRLLQFPAQLHAVLVVRHP